ncbi:MAG: tRNA lysidine(34) synthetase TilS [Thermodesulfobacteriota bacterium]
MEQINQSYLAACRSHPFIKAVEQTVLAYGMLGRGSSVLVAVSGGADSVALLCALWVLAPDYRWRLGAAHLNHCLRGESAEADAGFVEALAKCLDVSYYYRKETGLHALGLQKGVNLEEAGRNARYGFFRKIAGEAGFDKIAVGHHQQDTAEQVILNLLRGSGPSGLGGIPPVRERIIRPLIETPSAEIERFLQEQKISYCIDQSNIDNSFTRNRVRNHLIPELQAFNPRIVGTLSRISKVMRDEDDWIENLVTQVYEQAVIRRDSKNCEIQLSLGQIQSLHRAACRRIVRRAVCEVKGDTRRIQHSHIEAVVSMATKQAQCAGQIHLPGRVRVTRSRDEIGFRKEKNSLRCYARSGRNLKTIPFKYRLEAIKTNPESILIDEIRARFLFYQFKIHDIERVFYRQRQTGWVDMDRIEFPLVIRNPAPGDRFMPLGMQGTMKVKDFFINNKVKPAQRSRIPLVESGGRIIWVAGMRIDERVKITEDTENVLKICFSEIFTDQSYPEDLQIERL